MQTAHRGLRQDSNPQPQRHKLLSHCAHHITFSFIWIFDDGFRYDKCIFQIRLNRSVYTSLLVSPCRFLQSGLTFIVAFCLLVLMCVFLVCRSNDEWFWDQRYKINLRLKWVRSFVVLFADPMLHAVSEKNRVWRRSVEAVCSDAMLSFLFFVVVRGLVFWSPEWRGCVSPCRLMGLDMTCDRYTPASLWLQEHGPFCFNPTYRISSARESWTDDIFSIYLPLSDWLYHLASDLQAKLQPKHAGMFSDY